MMRAVDNSYIHSCREFQGHRPVFRRKNKKKIGPPLLFIPESMEQLPVFNYFCEYELANITFSQALW